MKNARLRSLSRCSALPNYTYAEVTWTQGLADWIGAHIRTFSYLDGCPEILVPDNLRSGLRLFQWAGTAVQGAGERPVLTSSKWTARPFPPQGYSACYGVLRLGQSFGDERLEAACARALALGTASYKSIESILKKGLDRRPLPEPTPAKEPVHHENLRGPDYYH